jgi:hypothetical protein
MSFGHFLEADNDSYLEVYVIKFSAGLEVAVVSFWSYMLIFLTRVVVLLSLSARGLGPILSPKCYVFRIVCKIARKPVLASSYLPVRLSVRMEQLGSPWTDFHEVWYLNIFRKSVEKIQILLKYDKNTGYFKCKPTHLCDHISIFFLFRMRNISEKCGKENQNTNCMFYFFFSENRAVYEVM